MEHATSPGHAPHAYLGECGGSAIIRAIAILCAHDVSVEGRAAIGLGLGAKRVSVMEHHIVNIGQSEDISAAGSRVMERYGFVERQIRCGMT